MSNTTKTITALDEKQAIRGSYNEINDSLTVDGFLVPIVGRKVTLAISTTTIASDTETYTFSESGTTLYVIKIIYTDGNRTTMLSAERTS